MIGELRFHFQKKQYTAVLEEDLRWHCEESQLEDYLNEVFSPVEIRRGRGGSSVTHYLYQVASRLGAEVVTARGEEPQAV